VGVVAAGRPAARRVRGRHWCRVGAGDQGVVALGAGDVAQLLARAEPEARRTCTRALSVRLVYQPALTTVLVNQGDLAW
jgi:hypothetical protein